MGAEAGAMIKNDTWYESELPKGKKDVSSRWIFTIKYKDDGKLRGRSQGGLQEASHKPMERITLRYLH